MSDTHSSTKVSRKRSPLGSLLKKIPSLFKRSGSLADTSRRQSTPMLGDDSPLNEPAPSITPPQNEPSNSKMSSLTAAPEVPCSKFSEEQSVPLATPSNNTYKAVTAGIKQLLKAIERSTDAFPPLNAPVAAVNVLIDIYDAVQENEDEKERLLADLYTFLELLKIRMDDDSLPDSATLSKFSEQLLMAKLKLLRMKEDGCVAKYAKNAVVRDELRNSSREIANTLQKFQLELGLQQERMTGEILKELVLAQMCISNEAPYTSAVPDTLGRRGCAEGTRVSIMNEICDWARVHSGQSCLFWLYGLAGTGKTTIAYSICEQLGKESILASSYFCSIQLDSRQSKLIIPTIARHLASVSRSFAMELVLQLQKDPNIAGARLQNQIESLLCRPWSASSKKRTGLQRPLLVIIDALDECDRGLEFLGLLLHAVEEKSLQGLKFLVTSRADPDLIKKWQAKSIEGSQVALHEMPRYQVERDIYSVLQSELTDLPYNDADLNRLSAQAGELFIVASTLVKYLHPARKLSIAESQRRWKGILELSPQNIRQSSRGIDQLYYRILQSALSQDDFSEEESITRLRILHAIACTAIPTQAEVIADLLTCDVGTVASVVDSLHSVLFTTRADSSIRIFHASFYDFLISKERSSQFYCSTESMHRLLGGNCFDIMFNRLKFNICGIDSSFIPDDQLDPPLDQRIEKKIGGTLAYACRHWWHHLRECRGDVLKPFVEPLRTLLDAKILFWVETMSLLGELRACRSTLSELESHASTMDHVSDILLGIRAASNLVSTFISMPPPRFTCQLYLSILPLSYESSTIKNWMTRFHHLPQVLQRQRDGRQHCRQVLHVHSLVTFAAFSPDGKHIVSSSEGQTMQIWDVGFSNGLRRLEDHKGSVNSAAFSPDGKHIVSRSGDNTIRIWDVKSGSVLRRLEGHTNGLSSAAFSPDGKHIVSSSYDKTIRIWDVESGNELRRLEGHTKWVTSAAFSPDGKHILSSSNDRTIRIWDFGFGNELRRFQGHTGSVKSASFSLDGKYIVSSSTDQTIRIWDVESGNTLRSLEGHIKWVTSASFSPDGKHIVSSSKDGTIQIWDVELGNELRKLDGHTDWVNSAVFSHDGRHIVSSSRDSTIRIWDIEFGNDLRSLEGHTDIVTFVAFSPDGRHIASGLCEKMIRIWDVDSGNELQNLEGHTHSVNSSEFSPDGKHILSSSGDRTIRIWDVGFGKELRRLDGHTGSVKSAAFSPNGKHIVSSSYDRTIRIWDVESGNEIRKLEGHTHWVNSAAFSPDGKYIVSSSTDQTIRIWEVEVGNELRRLEGHTGSVNSVAFSPHGKYIVSSSNDNTIQIWDSQSGNVFRRLEGHTNGVASAAFSPGGRQIVSSSFDKTIRIWDVESGNELRNLEGHKYSVNSAAFSPDGKHIVSGSSDKTVRIWNSKVGSVKLHNHYERCFSSPTFSHSAVPSMPLSDTLSLYPTDTSYHLKDDGWLVTSAEDAGKEVRIVWLPPPLRPFYPYQLLVIGRQGFNKIDFNNCIYGSRWAECYKGEENLHSKLDI